MEGSTLLRGSAAAEGAPLLRGSAPRVQVPTSQGKQRDQQGEGDVLFGKNDRSKTKKRLANTNTSDASKRSKQDGEKAERESTQRKTPSLLTFSKLVPGMRLLGCVKKVTTEKANIAFANNLSATITWSEASDEHFAAFEAGSEPPSTLPDIFPVGCFVPCIVTAVSSDVKEGKTDRLLRVSCRASLLNKAGILDANFASVDSCILGSVKSIEDRGVVINFGVKGLTGFLAFQAVSGGKRTVSFVGQPVQTVVVSRPSKAVANLKSIEPSTISTQETSSFATLQPGMMVEAKYVRNDLLDGGCLFSLWQAGFTATADWVHCGGDEIVGLSDKGDKKLCRIVWLDPSTKTFGFSLLEHLLELKALEWNKVVGETLQEAVVVKFQPSLGLQLSLPSNDHAFAHISKIVDSVEPPATAAVRKDFPVGKKLPCRILDLNQFDGLYIVSLQPSVLSAAVTSYENLLPGMKVTGKVVKVDAAFGILLELGQNVRGIVPTIHLSDSAGKETAPETRYKIGQVCKARVLSVQNDRVALTLKKSMVSTPLPVITSYEEATVNKVCHGFITKVDDFGVIVTFFGGVHGIVPAHTLGAQPAENPSEYFHVGQVVKARVVTVDPKQSRMRLSFNTTTPVASEGGDLSSPEKAKDSVSLPEIGHIITQAVVVSKNDMGIQVEFKFGDTDALIKGFVFKPHLSDFLANCENVHSSIAVGSKLKNLVVIRRKASSKDQSQASASVILSAKPEIVRSLKDSKTPVPETVEQVELEAVYTGYVSNITSFGVFVALGRGVTAFVPLANVWDSFVSQATDYFSLDQTVLVSITAVEVESKRITGSLKPSVVSFSSARYLELFLDDRRKSAALRNQQSILADQFKPGKVVLARVTHRVESVGVGVQILTTEEGATSKINEEIAGFCTIEHCPTQKLPKIGTELNFRVLDVDYSNQDRVILDLSARKSLETAKWRESNTPLYAELDCEVELGKKEYVILSYIPSAGKAKNQQKFDKDDNAGAAVRELALCSLVNFNNALHPHASLKTGTRCRARTSASGSKCLEFLHIASSASATDPVAGSKTRPRARSGSLSEFLGPRVDLDVGSLINAKIRDIRGCWMRLDVRQNASKPCKVLMHSTDVVDHSASRSKSKYELMQDVPSAFAGQSVGDVIQARVVEKHGSSAFLSMRPSQIDANQPIAECVNWTGSNVPKIGQTYLAWVDQVAPDGIWVGLSRHVRGFCFCTDVTPDLEALDQLFNGNKASMVFPVGRPVKVEVVDLNQPEKRLGLKMLWD